jgi:O-antigen/teichoic acid export membrane protein
VTRSETRAAAGTRHPAESRRRTSPQRLPQSAVTAGWRRHKDLLGSASSLVATTGLASMLGFVYWTLAARLFSQAAVGYGSAAVSAMTLLGTIGMLGLGTVLIGELPRRRVRAGLVSAALLASLIGSLVLGLGFAVLAPHFSQRFEHVSGTLVQAAVFVAGVGLTGVSLVFDQATIGLLRGGLQLSRNVLFGAAKLLALPAIALSLHDQFGVAITTSWVAGMAVSVVMVAIWLRVRDTPVLPRPDWGVLRGLGKTAVAHSWLNLSITVPRSLIPVLVTVVVSPTANGAFYAAWTLSGFLYIVPTHLSTVLFAVASGDPQVVARKLRFTLRLSFLIGLPGMLVLGLGAHLALSLFGPGYARAATVTLWLLVLGYLPTVPKMHFIAVCRAAGRISRAAVVLSVAAAMEVTAAAIGGASGGLKGLTLGLLAVFVAEGLVTTPPVLRAAMGRGRHRQAAPLAATALAETVPAHDSASDTAGTWRQPFPAAARPESETLTSAEIADTCNRDQQEAGIAALLLLAIGFADHESQSTESQEH